MSLSWIAPMPSAWSAPQTTESEASTRLLIIGLTIVVALLIGMLLYLFSQRSSQVQFQQNKADASATGAHHRDPASAVLPAILQELNEVPTSVQQRQRIARNVSEIVAKTVDQHVGTVKRQLDEHFEQVLQEKQRTETVLQRKYQEALVERKQTVSVLESIAEGLVVVNNKGEVVMLNPAAEKLLAVSQKERVGKPLLDNLRDEQLVSLMQGSNEDREIVLNAKQDSTKRVLRASNAVITDEDGKTVGMVAVLSDVTKQRQLDELKSEFVSKVSHELRTPLVAMQHALSILSDDVAGPMSEEQKKFVTLTQRNLERLNALINDLLDLSKLEARKMELRLETSSLTPVIQTVCESMEAWARSKALTLNKRLATDLPRVAFDQARITQVLTNLLGNAIKFTPKQGRITVEVKLHQDRQHVEVSVADTGVGIAKEDLPKLFNKFQQVGERSSSDIGGTGLGLAIAKEIVELHRGRIWAESEAHHGARFVFVLPLASAPS